MMPIDRTSGAGTALRAAVVAGILTGVTEAVIVSFRRLVLDGVVHFGPHLVWMAPLADVLLFLPFGFIAAVALRLLPRVDWLRGLGTVLTLLAGLSVTLAIPVLDRRAGALLAAGFAVQTWRLLGRRPSGSMPLVRRAPLLLGLLALLAAGTHGWQWLAERRALARLPAAPAGAPNVLLLVLDTVRALSLSLYGYERPTSPELDAFARRGVVFDRAFTTSPWTLPSHASMFTGRPAHEVSGTRLEPVRGGHPPLAEVLAGHGYATAGFMANQFYGTPEFGLGRGFHRYRVFPLTAEELLVSSAVGRRLAASGRIRRLLGWPDIANRKRASQVNRELLGWHAGLPAGRPFFAFLNYFDAHEPYLPPAPFDRRFAAPGASPVRSGRLYLHRQAILEEWRRRTLPPDEIRGERDAYDGSIAYLDHQVGELLDSLERRGALENTLVIVTSDHGEGLGEEGRFLHGSDLSRPSLHVPLVLFFKGRIPAGRRVAAAVSLQDLPATVLDIAGLSAPRLPGTSWAGFWTGSPGSVSGPVISSLRSYDERAQGASLVVDGRHLIRGWDGRIALFDLEGDPFEQRDLAPGSADAARIAGLRHLLDSLVPSRPE